VAVGFQWESQCGGSRVSERTTRKAPYAMMNPNPRGSGIHYPDTQGSPPLTLQNPWPKTVRVLVGKGTGRKIEPEFNLKLPWPIPTCSQGGYAPALWLQLPFIKVDA